jgi:hypothetical protein
MKTLIFCFILLFVFSCNSHQQTEIERKAERIANDEYIRSVSKKIIPIRASEYDLNRFLDSIYNLKDIQPQNDPMHFEDSVFHSRLNMSISLTKKEFEALKIGAKKGKLDLITANKIFKPPIDSTYISGNYVSISFLPFNINKDFNEFGICIGDYHFSMENDVYFFKQNRIIAFHHIYHRYGLDIESFKDTDKRTTIYYRANFGGGTPNWQFNLFFYKYIDDKLEPVLNIPESSNHEAWDNHSYHLESEIINMSPLNLQYFYSQELTDSTNNTMGLVNDSATVRFIWDEKKLAYTSKYSDKFSYRNLMSYIDYDNSYIIKSYYPFFKTILAGNDTTKKNIVLNYLDNVRGRLF